MADKILNKLSITNGTDKFTRDLTQIDVNKQGLQQVTDVVGVNAENVALINKGNLFATPQSLAQVKSSTNNSAELNSYISTFDRATATFEDDSTDAKLAVSLKDKAGADIAQVVTSASATENKASLVVNNKDGSAQGKLDVTFDGTSFKATAPSTVDHTSQQEIATKDYVDQEIADVEGNLHDATDTQHGLVTLSDAIDGTENAATGRKAATPLAVKSAVDKMTADLEAVKGHVAYTDTSNTFTKPQLIASEVADNAEKTFVNFRLGQFKLSDGTFVDGTTTSSNTKLATFDSEGHEVASFATDATATQVKSAITTSNANNSAKGEIAVTFNRGDNNFKATAPSALDHSTAQEIATTDWVNQQVSSATPQATTDVAGKVELATNEEAATGTDTERAITPAALAHVLNPIREEMEATQSGLANYALKDYTQEQNQSEMLLNVVYYVAFNSSNQYLQLDANNGYQPENPQPQVGDTPAPTDLNISYYVKMVKHSAEGPAVNAGRMYTAINFQGVAYTEKTNTFIQLNTFNGGIDLPNSGQMTDSNTQVANAGTVKAYTDNLVQTTKTAIETKYDTALANQKPQVVTSIPEMAQMTPGVLYIEVSE